MAEFTIKMADERGRVSEQVLTAATAEELKLRFTQAGYHVYSVKARSAFSLLGKRKVALDTFLIFNQQFLTLIKAGLPILGSIQMLAKNQRKAFFAAQLDDVATRLKTGESLSTAFEAQGGIPVMYTTTLLAGERSGNLPEVLERYVAFQRVSLTFRKKMISSLVYPCVLLFLVFGLLFFMFAYVVPKFKELYEQMGNSLPRMTVILLGCGGWLHDNLPWLALTVVVLAAALYRYSRTEGGRDRLDRIRLKTPILGTIWGRYQVAMFARTLSTLLTGGLPLVPSLETAARSISSSRIARATRAAIVSVSEGRPLAESLAETKVFPEMSTEMISVGEQTGALPQMLNSVAEFFEEDVATALATALTLVEPVILIIMGVVVLFILISLYLPIFSLGTTGPSGS